MADEKRYQVEHTSPTSYLDETDSVVQGYNVRVRLFQFGEVHTLQVPDLAPTTVQAEVEQLLAHRQALNELG